MPGSSEYFLARSSKFAPFFLAWARTSSAFFLISATSASVLPDGHEQDVLGVDAVGNLVLLNILLVDGLQFVVSHLGVLANLS